MAVVSEIDDSGGKESQLNTVCLSRLPPPPHCARMFVLQRRAIAAKVFNYYLGLAPKFGQHGVC